MDDNISRKKLMAQEIFVEITCLYHFEQPLSPHADCIPPVEELDAPHQKRH